MQSRWNESEAEALVTRYAPAGIGRDVALRVYTSRLLGGDTKLVLHGGGNTSVKTTARDRLGDEMEVLCVKGSGWDLGTIEPEGLPAVKIEPLRRLRALDALSDEDMVSFQRANLIDPMAPNPSVETLLHAFLPHKFVDHTHSTAVLSIADQPDAAELCAEIYQGRFALVPYIMPGFALAKKAAEIFEQDPSVEGMILIKHGIFSFGASAREAYERMISGVTSAEMRLETGRRPVFVSRALPKQIADLAVVAPILRGACSQPDPKRAGSHYRFLLEFRSSPAILDYVNGTDLGRYSQSGVVTPDHTIRTKNVPLLVPPPDAASLPEFRAAVHQAVDSFVAAYHDYFARNNARQSVKRRELDPLPRIVLVPGLGLVGLGRTLKDAKVAADIAENAIETITDAEAIGRFEALPDSELFEMEYWSLEQAKLGKSADKPLAGQIAAITGGGGTIGAAVARRFAAEGAHVAILDRDEAQARDVAKQIGGVAMAIGCDVTDVSSVDAAFAKVAATFGGLDLLVSNAGAAWQGKIGEVDEEILRQSFELNFFAHQKVAQAAVRIMLSQSTGGALLFNVSKQAVNPGPGFGPYGLPKAATLALVRQYAVEYGNVGIRANAVNADRIRSGLLSPDMIASRSVARGVSEHDYMAGNLLQREVTAEDVAEAFFHHAIALKTTADVTTVDGGNIAAAMR